MNDSIERKVRKLEPLNDNENNGSLFPFSRYLENPNIILLGDPGSGKTYLFNSGAEKENAKFFSVRQFLATEGVGCEGKTVYLDGLDEFRSRIDDKNAVIEVVRVLNHLNQPHLRLSCRVADWLGETDLSIFRAYFRESPFVVLNLEPLNEEEIEEILIEKGITEFKPFVHEASIRGLDSLLKNP